MVDERLEFISLAMVPGANFSLLCQRFGVSRKTAYKWFRRYQAGGESTLVNQSRRPRLSPEKTDEQVERQVVTLRTAHPTWGGRKLAARLRAMGSGHVPAVSTITEILRRQGLLNPAHSLAHLAPIRFEHPAANDLWQMDFKGHVPMSNQRRCHPLTALDDHSRYNLLLAACDNEREETVRGHLTAAFRKYGLPRRMLMDNGSPWGSGGYAAVSHWTRFTVWLARLGVTAGHGRPNHPQTQGKEERFHRTLNADLLRWHNFQDLTDAQSKLDPWRYIYNHERPHEAIGMAVPSSRYTPSPRPFPETLPPVEYDPQDLVRKVGSSGKLSIYNRTVMIGSALDGQCVALRHTRTDGLLDVYFCQVRLGRIDLRTTETASVRLARYRPLNPLAPEENPE